MNEKSVKAVILDLIALGRHYHALGISLATSSNYSIKIKNSIYLITASGMDKGSLGEKDFLLVDGEGSPLANSKAEEISDGVITDNEARKPSAETLVHMRIYRDFPERAGAVLHAHSPLSTVISKRISEGSLLFQGYEMQKAFPGEVTHDAEVEVPVIPNTQDMKELSKNIAARLSQMPGAPFVLIAGHGMYAWGKDLSEARRVVEAAEFLIRCRYYEMDLESK